MLLSGHCCKDQPVETVSEQFNSYNYGVVAYTKPHRQMDAAARRQLATLEILARGIITAIKAFRHPHPEDFKNCRLFHRMPIPTACSACCIQAVEATGKKIRWFLVQFHRCRASVYFISPAGFNFYDEMPGILLHNYTCATIGDGTGGALHSSRRKINGSWLQLIPGNNGMAELWHTAATCRCIPTPPRTIRIGTATTKQLQHHHKIQYNGIHIYSGKARQIAQAWTGTQSCRYTSATTPAALHQPAPVYHRQWTWHCIPT